MIQPANTPTYLEKLTTINSTKITSTPPKHSRPLYTANLMDEILTPIEGASFAPITTEDKHRIYQRWTKAPIVKVYGKSSSL